MSTTKHIEIREAVQAAFVGLAPAAQILGNRAKPLATGVASDLQVRLARSSSIDPALLTTGAPIDWQTELQVVIRTRDTAGASADAARDQLLAACYAALNAAPTLGGLVAYQVTTGLEWDEEEADGAVARCTWSLTLLHRTASHLLTA